MKVKFPAMQGEMGQRTYYSCLMKLNAVPKMFTFRDWIEFTPEEREQRVLNKKRVPEIARYMLDNEEGYLFSSITASYKCEVTFQPIGDDGLGYLEMDFESANFVINDGQHRCAAIAQAIRENPNIGEEYLSVILFPYENRARVQQMFSDLNRFVVKTSRSLDILFDNRDDLSRITLQVAERVTVFKDMIEKDTVSLPVRSEKMFTLASLYDANQELLKGLRNDPDRTPVEIVEIATEYWNAVAEAMPIWGKVKSGHLRAVELRQQNISTHAVVLRALGGIGADLLKEMPLYRVKEKLRELQFINWRRDNHEWENVCIIANSIVSNRQARQATKAYLKRRLGLALNDAERRSLSPISPEIQEEKNGNGGFRHPRVDPAGELTPPSVLQQVLLQSLRELGGSAGCDEVLDHMDNRLRDRLLPGDLEHDDQHRLKWRHQTHWQRLKLVHEGILKDDSPRGVWELA